MRGRHAFYSFGTARQDDGLLHDDVAAAQSNAGEIRRTGIYYCMDNINTSINYYLYPIHTNN